MYVKPNSSTSQLNVALAVSSGMSRMLLCVRRHQQEFGISNLFIHGEKQAEAFSSQSQVAT